MTPRPDERRHPHILPGTEAKDISLASLPPSPVPSHEHVIAHFPLRLGLDKLPQALNEYSAEGWEHYDSMAGQQQSAIVVDPRQGPEAVILLFLRRPLRQDISSEQITPTMG